MAGLVHLYYGMGKGKTTAAAGLCLRVLGHGGSVLFVQFLKDGTSGEVASLEKLGVRVIAGQQITGFFHQLPPARQETCRRQNSAAFAEAARVMSVGRSLVVLDEVVDAVALGLLDIAQLTAALQNRHPDTEVVLTGHDAPETFTALADYITEMAPHRHPHENGVGPRPGIEY